MDEPVIGMGWILILTPICTLLGAALLGALQLLFYRLLRRWKAIPEDGIPVFPVLLFRGMLGMLALIATGAIVTKLSGVRFWEDPMLTDEAQRAYRQILDRDEQRPPPRAPDQSDPAEGGQPP